MTTPQEGRRPLPSELKWRKLAETLSPEKALERVYANVKSIISNVTTIGTLLGGLGIIAATTLLSDPWLLVGAVLTSLLAAIAVTIALWALIARQTELASENLVEVETWYRREMKRGKSAAVAGWFLFAAGIVASATALVGGVGLASDASDPTPQNGVVVDVSTGENQLLVVHLGGQVTGVEDDERVLALLTKRDDPHTVYMDVLGFPDASGKVAFDASAVVPVGTEIAGEVKILQDDEEVDSFEIDLARETPTEPTTTGTQSPTP